MTLTQRLEAKKLGPCCGAFAAVAAVAAADVADDGHDDAVVALT